MNATKSNRTAIEVKLLADQITAAERHLTFMKTKLVEALEEGTVDAACHYAVELGENGSDVYEELSDIKARLDRVFAAVSCAVAEVECLNDRYMA
jgi:hypothetical protein